jgi:UDP-glucose 4-epimerase
LVLGAAGFIGRHVCRELATRGFEVHGHGHGDLVDADLNRWGLSTWVRDDLSPEALNAAVQQRAPVAVLHCAGSGSVSSAYDQPLEAFHRSVSTVAALAEAVRQCGRPNTRLVLTSSAAVYGDQGDVDLTETSVRSPISPYGFHKVAAESVCDSYSRFFGLHVSVVRLFSVYGDGLRKQLLWDALNKFSRGEHGFFGTGHELRDWIHVEDAARLLCTAAEAPQGHFQIYNGGHEQATTREVLTRLAEAWGAAAPPQFSGETHTGNPRRLTSDWGHAHRQLGWVPEVGLTQGLARYAAWFRQLSR